jgi:hypothetical protein
MPAPAALFAVTLDVMEKSDLVTVAIGFSA